MSKNAKNGPKSMDEFFTGAPGFVFLGVFWGIFFFPSDSQPPKSQKETHVTQRALLRKFVQSILLENSHFLQNVHIQSKFEFCCYKYL